jgi:hypothetical protein
MPQVKKVCRTLAYGEVRVGKHLSDVFPFQNGLKHGAAVSPLLLKLTLEYTIRKVQENKELVWDTLGSGLC